MKFIWDGQLSVVSPLLTQTPTKRDLRAYGLTIGWMFFGLAMGRRVEIENPVARLIRAEVRLEKIQAICRNESDPMVALNQIEETAKL